MLQRRWRRRLHHRAAGPRRRLHGAPPRGGRWPATRHARRDVHGPGEGEHHDAGSAQILIKVAGEHTGGSFFLAESTLAPGFAGPPPHRHRELHDMFYVLDGTLTLRLGGRTIEAGPGSFACVPPGVVHTFRNDSEDPVRILNFNTPAGWENYMRELADAAQSAPLTPEVIARVASRYDFEFTE